MDEILDPKTLADDLTEAHHIHSRFFAALNESDRDKPVKGSPKEWNLHETIAHLVALNGAGLESIKSPAPNGETIQITSVNSILNAGEKRNTTFANQAANGP